MQFVQKHKRRGKTEKTGFKSLTPLICISEKEKAPKLLTSVLFYGGESGI